MNLYNQQVHLYYYIDKLKKKHYMASKFLDNLGLTKFWDLVKQYILDTFYTKEHIDSMYFVGTKAEYEKAWAEGQIAINALVIITDDVSSDNMDSAATSSILGQGVLGQMILG